MRKQLKIEVESAKLKFHRLLIFRYDYRANQSDDGTAGNIFKHAVSQYPKFAVLHVANVALAKSNGTFATLGTSWLDIFASTDFSSVPISAPESLALFSFDAW